MELIRLISKTHHWARRKRRFSSAAFKNYRGSDTEPPGGVSVIKRQCILDSGREICEHIRTYYPDYQAEGTIVFWCFSSLDLPQGYKLIQKTTKSGDVCHYDITGLEDEIYDEWFDQYKSQL